MRPGRGAPGELAGLAQELQGLLAVAHDVQRAADLVLLECLPGHQHVGRVVLDQQHVRRSTAGHQDAAPVARRPGWQYP
jgi:hypothetical protein